MRLPPLLELLTTEKLTALSDLSRAMGDLATFESKASTEGHGILFDERSVTYYSAWSKAPLSRHTNTMESSAASSFDFRAPIRPRAPGCPIPLTTIQRLTWNRLVGTGNPVSTRLCASAIRIRGLLDVELLQRCLEEMIRRHDSLRTRIVVTDGTPQHYIETDRNYRLNLIDMSDQPGSGADSQVKTLVQEFIDRRIDLSKDPFFEARLWKLSDQEHVLVLMIHHIISDGISNGILARELWTLYEQASEGKPFSLPPLPIQFADYAVWHQQAHDAWLLTHSDYWKQHLQGSRRVEIPVDNGCEPTEDAIGITTHIPFGDVLSAALRDIARRERSLLSLVVMAGYAIVMMRWCRQDDILIELMSHGRHRRPELNNVIGFLANGIICRVAVGHNDTFHGLLNRVQAEFSASLAHEDLNRIPEFIPECYTEASFNWQPTAWAGGRLDHHVFPEFGTLIGRELSHCQRQGTAFQDSCRLLIEPFPARSPTPLKFCPVFFDSGNSIHLIVSYQPRCLSSNVMDSFGRSLLSVLEQITISPSIRIAALTDHMC